MDNNLIHPLQSYFGFSHFRPGQQEAILSVLDNKHTLVVMPTGSGKSLIYQLSGLLLPGVTLVISPLIALMKDQVDSLDRHGIRATYLNSSLSVSEQNSRLKGLTEGAYRLMYVSPERLRNVQFIKALHGQVISLLAVDEAHCISEWGHDFRPDYMNIANFRSIISEPLTIALTATATPQVQKDIIHRLGLSKATSIVTGFNRPNLALEVIYISSPVERLKTLRRLMIDQKSGATIIYAGTRRDAEEVSEFVGTLPGKTSHFYHAGLPAEQRTQIQNAFMAGESSVVVATNAFGMGIDRADVRQVIHYSMPGSIEAYYQEAGRAGRDGLPAKVALLYSPEDRALQEWFIENSIISINELHKIYNALNLIGDHKSSFTLETLSATTSLPMIKVRVGLAGLEGAGAITNGGVEGLNMRFHINVWNEAAIKTIHDHFKLHQNNRKSQLNAMINYAESNYCRRRIILNYFGDTGPADAQECCDNCRIRHASIPITNNTIPLPGQKGSSSTELIPLIILDAIKRLKREVGREKITQILKGSKARDILRFGYNKSVYYGRLDIYPTDMLIEITNQLIELRYIKVIGGKYPVLRLTLFGEAAIRNREIISLDLPKQIDMQTLERKKAQKKAGGTLEYTWLLMTEGFSIEQIAAKRGLAKTTIYGHCAQLIASGRMEIDQVVPEDVKRTVEQAIQDIGSAELLSPIKALLPETIDFNILRCVVENWKLNNPLPGIREDSGTPSPSSEDSVVAFLSQPHPRQLLGAWDDGWALGFYSQFSGASWKRSESGELAYALKYQGDISVLPKLVEQACTILANHPEMTRVDGIISVPASIPRANDPVSCFAKTLSEKLSLPYTPILAKSRQTFPQKEMHTLAQKKANVSGAFELQSSTRGSRWLVIDDLFDSGATLDEICRLLQRVGASYVSVLTLSRTIHADA